ncbi:polysaccharide biosynthesis tyrosine autokinase [Microbacterium sp.]|uniref:polysaccharide biosynthesis tyrosine autokinase n=1 Tax=Microbacterium sp. TaxID=51671 RepID=UPI0025CC5161|nr:polysaccharide biosynthesis tyrosine autokinase [Microbacterium sp.]
MELRDYLRILRAHWVGILLLTLLGTAVAFGYSSLQPRVYTAEATGYVTTLGSGTDVGSSLVGNQLAQAKVKSFVAVGTWRAVAEFAIDELDLDTTPEALVGRVDVSNPLDTIVIVVNASAGTPEEARDLAEAWIRGMILQIDELEGDGTSGSSAVTVVAGDSARLPTAPSSPNTRLNVALGALIGLALGIGYAVIRHVLDRRLRDPRDIERETGVAVVGTIPLDKDLAASRRVLVFDEVLGDGGSVIVAEALRELRTNLQFMSVDNPPRSIVVTSPVPGDGKSTTAANLAVSLAAAGEPVILIDADLRRPVISSLFALPEGAGLTDVIAGRATVDDVSHRIDDSLVVIGAGRIPPNPSELLGSQRMRDLVKQLSESALVIIDTPPLLPVTDAAIIATRADGALIVTSAGHTTYDMLQKALENLERANARALGVVLNKVPRRGGSAGYYGYQYQSYQRKEEDRPRKVKPSGTTTEAAPGPRRSSTEPGGPAIEAEALPTGQRSARRSDRTDS